MRRLHALKQHCWCKAPCTYIPSPLIWHHRNPCQQAATAAASCVGEIMSASTSSQEQPVMLYRFDDLLQGSLHKRYKRFLADVDFASGGSEAAATAAFTKMNNRSPLRGRRSRKEAVETAAATAAAVASIAATQQLGGLTVVHCPNTGSMAGLLNMLPAPAACSVSNAATRKYKHTLESICLQSPNGPVWVGVHSALANKLAAELLRQQLLPELGQYTAVQPEIKLGGSSSTRLDFLLTRRNGRKLYVEVKSVTMAMPHASWCSSSSSKDTSSRVCDNKTKRKRPAASSRKAAGFLIETTEAATKAESGAAAVMVVPAPAAPDTLVAVFPDAVSERARRHVQDLMQLKAAGHDAVCIFVIQRNDCSCFAPAAHIDPAYAAAVKAACAAGVQMLAVVCEFDPEQKAIWFKGTVPVIL